VLLNRCREILAFVSVPMSIRSVRARPLIVCRGVIELFGRDDCDASGCCVVLESSKGCLPPDNAKLFGVAVARWLVDPVVRSSDAVAEVCLLGRKPIEGVGTLSGQMLL
jgi:hypothetical protein